jgi:adenylate cyclase
MIDRDALERGLEREILEGERFRAALLSCVIIGSMTGVLLVPSLFPQLLRGLPQRLPVPLLGLLMSSFLGFELTIRWLAGRALARGETLPTPIIYACAAAETSLPTIAIWVLAHTFEPAYALLLPPILLYGLFILASTLRFDFWLSVFTGAVAAGEYLALAATYVARPTRVPMDPVLVLLPHHFAKSVVLMVSGVVAGLVAREIKRRMIHALQSFEERNRIVQLFGQHVSPAVVDKLLGQHAELPTEMRNVCVMFLDIRNFTDFAEKRSPEDVVRFLNTLFTVMIDCVNRHHGIVNKFLGDGLLAVFGAPLSDGLDSRNAVRAALEILSEIETLSASGAIPKTRLGIGLHAGPAVTGNVGSPSRKEYTVIGDVVNLASRIEALNKQFDSQLLVSDEVWQAVDQATAPMQTHDQVTVKGRSKPVRLYQLA